MAVFRDFSSAPLSLRISACPPIARFHFGRVPMSLGVSANEREIMMSYLLNSTLNTKETLLVLLCTVIAHAGALAFTLG